MASSTQNSSSLEQSIKGATNAITLIATGHLLSGNFSHFNQQMLRITPSMAGMYVIQGVIEEKIPQYIETEKAVGAFVSGALMAPATLFLEQISRNLPLHNLRTHWITPIAIRDGILGIGLFYLPNLIKRKLPDSMSESRRALIGSATSGMIVGTLTTPFERIRSLMQLSAQINPHHPMKILEAFDYIHTQNGPIGFWKYGGIRSFYLDPDCTLILSI